MRIIVSGGGTGGHIYPAVAVIEALERRFGDDLDVLFVGAEGKMEMEKVPALGYRIVGLPVAGFQRRFCMENLWLPVKIVRSLAMAYRTIRNFKADVVVGFGGYASGPTLFMAQMMGIPTLIQEQNSYAGVTNKLLGRRAKKVCVAYQGMERFFSEDKIVMTGNPLRGSFFCDDAPSRSDALRYFGLREGIDTLLIVGGSLGTRTLNEVMKRAVDKITSSGKMQVIWQSGSFYEKQLELFMSPRSMEGIWRGPFIDRMDLAYAAADVVVARAGACTVSELCLVGKPVIFVPSPNVAEDHQTKNAQALLGKGAAIMIPDSQAIKEVMSEVESLLANRAKRIELSDNILSLAMPDSSDRVADQILLLVEEDVKKKERKKS